jgi:hypothetical protein
MYDCVDIELRQCKHAAMLCGASDRTLDPGHTEAPDPNSSIAMMHARQVAPVQSIQFPLGFRCCHILHCMSNWQKVNAATASLYIIVISAGSASHKVNVPDLVYLKSSSLRKLQFVARKQLLHQLKALLEHDVWLLVLGNTSPPVCCSLHACVDAMHISIIHETQTGEVGHTDAMQRSG